MFIHSVYNKKTETEEVGQVTRVTGYQFSQGVQRREGSLWAGSAEIAF